MSSPKSSDKSKETKVTEEPPKSILKTHSNDTIQSKEQVKKNATFSEYIGFISLQSLNRRINDEDLFAQRETPDFATQGRFDFQDLKQRLRVVAKTQVPPFGDDELSDEEFPEMEDEEIHRLEFEKRRKRHYQEFFAVKKARKLIEEEWDAMSYDDLSHEASQEVLQSVYKEPRIEKAEEKQETKDETTKSQTFSKASGLASEDGEENIPYLETEETFLEG